MLITSSYNHRYSDLSHSCLQTISISIIQYNYTDRPSSVIIMTDGRSHRDVTRVINRLKQTSDPLIGAGIGTDTDIEFLLTLSSNLSTVVYEPDRNRPIQFGRRIIEVMRDTAVLCPDEGIVL